MNELEENRASFAAYECKSFYKAYQKLRDATLTQPLSLEYFWPWMVNGAFAAELAIKVLLKFRQIRYEKVHELMPLLFLLPDDILSEFYCELKQNLSAGYSVNAIARGLYHISNAFMELRYSFEYGGNPIDSAFMDAFVTAICTVAIRHHNVDYVKEKDTITDDSPEYSKIDRIFIEGEQAHLEQAVERVSKIQRKLNGE